MPSRVEGPHDYFNKLIARDDVFTVDGVPRAYSLRPVRGAPRTSPYYEHQLAGQRQGGYVTGGEQANVTYSPDKDNDPRAQDAAKVVVRAFIPQRSVLTQPIDSAERWIPVDPASELRGQNDRTIRIGSELMTMTRPCARCPIADKDRVYVTRGTFGTAASPHPAGAPIDQANSSLQNQIRVPINTIGDANATYFATWDGFWTDSYIGAGIEAHKTFQFSSGGNDDVGAIWLEPRTLYDGGSRWARHPRFDPGKHVAVVDVRSYNRPGGAAEWSATDGNSLGPVATRNPLRHVRAGMAGKFLVYPNRWTRWFVQFDVRVNDYDYFSMWVADEQTPPVKIIDQLPVSIRVTGNAPNSIKKWWIELNTSLNEHTRAENRDLVTYFRNFVMLKDPRDIPSLLVKPVGQRD